MFLLLDDTTSARTLSRVLGTTENTFTTNVDVEQYSPSSGDNILRQINLNNPLSRWSQLYFASKGARMYSDKLSAESPLYAGKSLSTEDDIVHALKDLQYAQGRAAYFESYGVNYVGRSYSDPRNIIVVDNKAGNKALSPVLSEEYATLYETLPEDWWQSCGFVSTGNVDKLSSFLEDLPDTIKMGYSTGALAKLKYSGVDYAVLPVPEKTTSYGILVREKANRLSYELRNS